ncbi:MAG: acetyltransferase, partial [Lachnospiraceae bacterium]|nr:acetyltransferase [Lachnospiraceae bacterium]
MKTKKTHEVTNMVLLVYGAGGLGREIVDLAQCINRDKRRWNEICFIVDAEFIKEKRVYDCEALSFEEALECQQNEEAECIIAVGEPASRQKMYDKCKKAGFRTAKLVAPSAFVSEAADIGEGVIISHYVVILAQCRISNNVMLQPMCVIGHDIVIGANSVIGPHVLPGGGCVIGENVFIGMGATIREQVKIGPNSIISMGAVVYNDIPDGMIVLGNPARPMRRNE